ncbi:MULTISPECIES: phosphoribosylanthranilate isomerase [Acidithiobacillus]|jgi:phosphoribosylanthranilate isomerase|uniref:N-(5'-phosphoribosyl)anthranilate isomerase n=3 Tax=Acidithiobacillus caldus TaxID=33059 RepID=F9ZS12_ACICS|nr:MULTISPECIES: phosphoribosylanthranilate isomerase [Acidithiobacillus]AEK58821.1 Phosphoribosylanthranilate isomerase [Acidithiobacillus caldus SM-1]AIA55857.1 Phosphoribosylanthranilate isomerase [Acidithiobacillus caldus ATCC 51756]AUW33234.1 phosphoribosylanthranilate isomerase [Acidithiobacillus caldus]MBU2729980.1 phosphoribosylanthranilate isomerase [Acidithiobacillus caldus]MBU2736592.1 phosphoribosylanthranilate isomerase [Acidithiobacillus caldus ATCC 51756]
MLRIKICGITRVEDALAAAEAGADAIGLVFYPPSPRYVEIATAQAILAALPPFVTRVGLFVNPEAHWVRAVTEQCLLDLLQFHGDETDEFCSGFGRPYIKALRLSGPTDLHPWRRRFPGAQALLLDKENERVYGGSGEAFAWWPLPADLGVALILAGGLRVDNVAQAVRLARPYAVDVSSGVEVSPGQKDRGKIRNFIHCARAALQET